MASTTIKTKYRIVKYAICISIKHPPLVIGIKFNLLDYSMGRHSQSSKHYKQSITLLTTSFPGLNPMDSVTTYKVL
nr:MAG TPA: hypothetical protein [Caudoviricetes sp.]